MWIITIQDYKHTKLMWMEVHMYSVKAKSQAGKIWVKHIMTTWKGQIWKIFCQGS